MRRGEARRGRARLVVPQSEGVVRSGEERDETHAADAGFHVAHNQPNKLPKSITGAPLGCNWEEHLYDYRER